MKLSITKEKFIALLILLPYVENNFLQEYIQFYFKETYIRAISVISIIVTLSFVLLIFAGRRKTGNQGYKFLMIGFVIYTLFQVFLGTEKVFNSFCVWIWISVPMIFALVVSIYCEQRRLNYRVIITSMIRWFCAYLVVLITYYIAVHHLFIDSTVRLSPRGGGAVIFGYTIALVFAFCVQYRDYFSKKEYYILLVILSVGALATTSRAAVWPVVFLWIANFMFTKLTLKKLIATFLLLLVVIFLSTVDLNSLTNTTTFIGFGRLFNISSLRRYITLANTLILFGKSSLVVKLFGAGLNNFFPYQKWAMSVNDVDFNMITREGISVLVQPHNSFIYSLMESGTMGLFFLIGTIVYAGWSFVHYKTDNFVFKIAFIGVLFLVNCFDSVFYVQPGTAGTFWLLLLITINENRHRYYSSKENIRKTI